MISSNQDYYLSCQHVFYYIISLVTGHADGSVRFWDTSTNCMQALCRVRTQKLFEKNKSGKVEGGPATEDDPYAITGITLSPDCKSLLLAGQSAQVSQWFGKLFKYPFKSIELAMI